MGTETRIGIVAGLSIVVIASVYFYYGQSRPDQDILVSANPSVSPPPKIPQAEVTPTGGAPVRKFEPIVTKTIPKPAVVSSPVHAPPVVTVATLPPSTTPKLTTPPSPSVSNPPPKPVIAAPFFPTVARSTPVSKPPVDINADPIDTSDDLAESSWDHLAKPQPQESKIFGQPSHTPTVAQSTPNNTNSVKHDTITPASPPPQKIAAHEATRPISPSTTAELPWPRRHTVASGDTLVGISFQYYEDHSHVDQIVAANPQLKNPRALKIGQVLSIPQPQQKVADLKPAVTTPTLAAASSKDSIIIPLAGRTAVPAAKTDKQEKTSPSAADKSATKLVVEKSPDGEKSYTTQDGDTFYSLAKKFYKDGRKWQKIYDANKAVVKNDPKRLRKGMVLQIPH